MIRKSGFISFARFMDLALYCPVYGYYEKEKDTTGKHGDFFTSVSVGRLFGELLAVQFAEWLTDNCGRKSPTPTGSRCEIGIIEAGAHDGTLAKDILFWLRGHRPSIFRRLNYCIIEPSARRQFRQREALSGFAEKIIWAKDWKEMRRRVGRSGIRGVIFSNELLDAMPVHRLGWDAVNRLWFEWGVALENERLVWVKIRNPAGNIRGPELPVGLKEVLPDGFSTEICPAAEAWWREAARALCSGRLLTLDYGLAAEEFFMPERNEGTLRAYHRHHLSKDVLACAGEQDITAHVNFTAIQAAGEALGLSTEAFTSQENFLVQIAGRIWKRNAGAKNWTPERMRQFQTLIHPQHLGRKFRVLIQSRG